MQVELMSRDTQARELRDCGITPRSGVHATSKGQTRQDLEGNVRLKGLEDSCPLVSVWRGLEPRK